MSVLDRYIARHLLTGWLMVFALLAVIFGLFAFIDELNHTLAEYQALQALQFVAMSTFQRTLDLIPVIALLGTMVAFATLSRHNELAVILTSGISALRQLWAVCIPAGLLMLLLWPLGEFIAAPLDQRAESSRLEARTGSKYSLKERGLWTTDGQHFYHIGALRRQLIPRDIEVFDMDDDGRLVTAMHASHARIVDGRIWELRNVQIKQNVPDPVSGNSRLITTNEHLLQRGNFWSSKELASLTLSTSSMSLLDLHKYLGHLESTGQDAGSLPHQFWQRLMLPITAASMVLLAMQLSLGLLLRRDQSFSMQVGIGIAISMGFYLLSQVIYAAGALYKFDAAIVACTPIMIVLSAAIYLQRHRP